MIRQREFAQRRAKLLAQMPPNSIAVIAAAKLVTRSRDTDYAFRQHSDFYYACGFPEPDALLVLSNQGQSSSILFCQPNDPQAEIWHGRRIGIEAAREQFAIDETYPLSDATLALPELLNGHKHLYFAQGEQPDTDQLVFSSLKHLREAPKQSKSAPDNLIDIRPLLHNMRLFKSDTEIALIQRSADISVGAHLRAMRSASTVSYEYQLQAEIEHEFAVQGADAPAYSSIVGSGGNACILHYTENRSALNRCDLVLIDAGAEYQGYAADITRTFPLSGRFSEPQRQLYQLVLKAQQAAFDWVKPGSNFKLAGDHAILVLTQGLLDLGLLQGDLQQNIDDQSYRAFYMHGIGHWLGLDVHDVGNYRMDGQDVPFEPGMVLTIEPGLYIDVDAEVDEKWRGIGIRIEDNLLITESGHKNLTAALPTAVEEIESLMKAKRTGL